MSDIYHWIFRFFAEFCIYVTIDHLMHDQHDQHDQSDGLLDEQSLLFLKSLFLLYAACLVYSNHVPYFLLVTSCITFIRAFYSHNIRVDWKECRETNEHLRNERDEIQKVRAEKGTCLREITSGTMSPKIRTNSFTLPTSTIFYDGENPPGILNPGSEDFIHSILQIISRTPRLVEYTGKAMKEESFQGITWDEIQFLSNIFATFALLSNKFTEIGSEGRACFSKRVIDATELKKSIMKLLGSVVAHDSNLLFKHNAGDFLFWLVNTLDTILVTRAHTPSMEDYLKQLKEKCHNLSPYYIQQLYYQIRSADGTIFATYQQLALELSNIEFIIYKEKKKSIIADLFEGQRICSLFCRTCRHISMTFQSFSILILPTPADTNGIIKIENCFKAATAISNLNGLNGLQCDFCAAQAQGMHTSGIISRGNFASTASHCAIRQPDTSILSSIPLSDGQKQLSYSFLPDFLLVQLTRTDSLNRKIQTRVKVNAGLIDLSCLDLMNVEANARNIFEMYGACIHRGVENMETGHYSSLSLAVDGRWYFFNDHKVRLVPDIDEVLEKDIVQQGIYIICYRRVR